MEVCGWGEYATMFTFLTNTSKTLAISIGRTLFCIRLIDAKLSSKSKVMFQAAGHHS